MLAHIAKRWEQSLDIILGLISAVGLGVSVLLNFPLKTSPDVASDLKTLFASAWNFTHGLDAYSIRNVESAFISQGVVVPANWFGHAPVYPPTTLALISPFVSLPMSASLYFITILSVALLCCALVSLLTYAREEFSLSLIWRAVLVCLCASGPLLSFALGVGNLSVAASALAIIAFTRRNHGWLWLSAGALAMATLLKPHLAIWFVLGMMVLPQLVSRRIALRAISMTAIFAALTAVGMAITGTLTLQMRSFAKIIAVETSAGASMSASSHEALPSVSQITSLQSIVGFWTEDRVLINSIAGIALLIFAVLLLRETLKVREEKDAVVAMAAWIALGLLFTYHRSHDGIGLLIIMPYLLARVRRHPEDWRTWLIVGIYGVMSVGPQLGVLEHHVEMRGSNSSLAFLLLRQSALAVLAMLLLLLSTLRQEVAEEASESSEPLRLDSIIFPARQWVGAMERRRSSGTPPVSRATEPRKEGSH